MWYDKRMNDGEVREEDSVPSFRQEIFRAGIGLIFCLAYAIMVVYVVLIALIYLGVAQ